MQSQEIYINGLGILPEEYEDIHSKKILRRRMMCAFVLRIIALLFICMFFSKLGNGFLSSNITNDDVRYLAGGQYYANNASSLFDFETFTIAYETNSDLVGRSIVYHGILYSSPLWYWVVCFLMYITKTDISVRLFNIILSVLSIKHIYNMAYYVYGKKVATLSSRLLAYLPLQIVFCCFAYKDIFIMYIILYLFSKAVRYRKGIKYTKAEVVHITLNAIFLVFLRGGFSVAIIAVFFIIMFVKKPTLTNRVKVKILFLGIIATAIVFFVTYRFLPTLSNKINAYIIDRSNDGNMISKFTIYSIKELYKLPLTYIFTMIMPVELFAPITSWGSIIGNIAFVMCPISVGAFLYLFRRKTDGIVYYSTISLYLISIVTSTGIFRHYFSLIPINLIFFSAFRTRVTGGMYYIYLFLSVAFAGVLILFYIIR